MLKDEYTVYLYMYLNVHSDSFEFWSVIILD